MQIVNETVRYDIYIKFIWNKMSRDKTKHSYLEKEKTPKKNYLKMSFLFIYTIVFVVHSNHPEKDEQHPDKL